METPSETPLEKFKAKWDRHVYPQKVIDGLISKNASLEARCRGLEAALKRIAACTERYESTGPILARAAQQALSAQAGGEGVGS